MELSWICGALRWKARDEEVLSASGRKATGKRRVAKGGDGTNDDDERRARLELSSLTDESSRVQHFQSLQGTYDQGRAIDSIESARKRTRGQLSRLLFPSFDLIPSPGSSRSISRTHNITTLSGCFPFSPPPKIFAPTTLDPSPPHSKRPFPGIRTSSFAEPDGEVGVDQMDSS